MTTRDYGYDPDDWRAAMTSGGAPPEEQRLDERRPAAPGGGGDRAPVGRSLADLVGPAFDRMEARGRGVERRLPVPWRALALALNARAVEALDMEANDAGRDLPDAYEVLRPGVHVLVGGTGSGKTQLALSLALEAALDGRAVSYVGLELDEVGIVARLAGLAWARGRRLDAVAPDDLRAPEWSERWSAIDWPGGRRTVEGLRRVRAGVEAELVEALGHLRIVTGGARGGANGVSADDLAAVLADVRERSTPEQPGLVVLDFLQLLAPGDRDAHPDDREIRTRIARAAYAANNATTDGRLAVLLVSATARDKYGELDGVKLNDLKAPGALVGTGKESGEIEYAATSVLVIARASPAQSIPAWEPLGPGGWGACRFVAVAKNRHGRCDWFALGFDGGAFYEVNGDPKRLDATIAAARAASVKSKMKMIANAGAGDDDGGIGEALEALTPTGAAKGKRSKAGKGKADGPRASDTAGSL